VAESEALGTLYPQNGHIGLNKRTNIARITRLIAYRPKNASIMLI